MHVWDCTVENNLKELIANIYISKMHLLFSSLSLKNFVVNRVGLEELWDGWPFEIFFGKCQSEDKAYWKVSCWFVGTFIHPESNWSILLRSRKGLLTKAFDRLMVLTDEELSEVLPCGVSYSVSRQQLGTLQMILEQISLPVQYALRTNQSEVSGHVTPKRITSEWEVSIHKLCRYETVQLRMI